MFLTHCVMGWIALAVLSLCLPVWSIVKVTQPYSVLSTDGTAQISCVIHPRPAFHQVPTSHAQQYPYPNPEDLRVGLLKGLHGKQELCWTMLNINEVQQKTERRSEGEVQCSAEARGDAVQLTVSGLKVTDTDIYRCDIQVFYPPPFLNYTGNGTLIHVAGSSRCPERMAQNQLGEGDADADDANDDEEEENEMTSISVPVVILVIAIICVLVVILSFQTLQCEQGRRKVIWTLPPVEHHKVDAVSFLSENIA